MEAHDFESIFKDNYTQLYYFAFDLTGDEEASKDLVSEVFMMLWRRHEDLKDDNIAGYLFVCLRNKCFSYLKEQKGKQEFVDYCRTTFTEEDESYWDALEDRIHDMDAVVATLPERTRFVLEQCYYHQHTYKEVGDMLGISTNGVKKHIMKAFATLREHYHVRKGKT